MIENRLLRAIQAIVRATFPNYMFLGKYRYRVVRKVQYRYELQAVDATLGLPDLLPISTWQGLAGTWCDLALGSEVLVEFIAGDPGQPIISHYSPRDAAGWIPATVLIQGSTEVKLGGDTGLATLAKAASTQSAIDAIVVRLNACLAVLFTAQPPATPTPVVTAPIVVGVNNVLPTQTIAATTKVRAI